METVAMLVIPAVLTLAAVRLMLLPLRGGVKFIIHAACGFLCLWLVNLTSGLTGVNFPVNAVTVLTAGFLGLPGMGVMALLALG